MKLTPTPVREALSAMLYETAERHCDQHGVAPTWAYVSPAWREAMMGRQPNKTLYVNQMLCVTNPNLDGITVATFAGRYAP